MADIVTGDIIAKTHAGLVPLSSDNDKERLRDWAVGEWISDAFEDATAGNAVGQYPFFRVPYACTIKKVFIVAGNTVAANGTDYATITVQAMTAGVGRSAVATDTQAANLNGLTAFVPKECTLSSTQANLELAAGDVLTLAVTKAGSGKALSTAVTATGGKAAIYVYLERKYA